jgi:hypothetical protein
MYTDESAIDLKLATIPLCSLVLGIVYTSHKANRLESGITASYSSVSPIIALLPVSAAMSSSFSTSGVFPHRGIPKDYTVGDLVSELECLKKMASLGSSSNNSTAQETMNSAGRSDVTTSRSELANVADLITNHALCLQMRDGTDDDIVAEVMNATAPFVVDIRFYRSTATFRRSRAKNIEAKMLESRMNWWDEHHCDEPSHPDCAVLREKEEEMTKYMKRTIEVQPGLKGWEMSEVKHRQLCGDNSMLHKDNSL